MEQLRHLRVPLEIALENYEEFHDGNLTFGEFPNLVLTPDKPYTARTVVPVFCNNQSVGDMYVLVFKGGDATGSDEYYDPTKLSFIVNSGVASAKLTPRRKVGVLCEGFFPLFSQVHQNPPVQGVARLNEVTLRDDYFVDGLAMLGVWNYFDFLRAVVKDDALAPAVTLTVGTTAQGVRFGDPHALYALQPEHVQQVVGFLSVKDQKSPLHEISKRYWQLPNFID